MHRTFRQFVEERDAAGMDYRTALDFVLTKLRLHTDREDRDTVLSMPIRGYGRDAVKSLMEEPTLRGLPNFQTHILPALTRPETTVGRLVGLIAEAPKDDRPRPEPEVDAEVPPDNPNAAF